MMLERAIFDFRSFFMLNHGISRREFMTFLIGNNFCHDWHV